MMRIKCKAMPTLKDLCSHFHFEPGALKPGRSLGGRDPTPTVPVPEPRALTAWSGSRPPRFQAPCSCRSRTRTPKGRSRVCACGRAQAHGLLIALMRSRPFMPGITMSTMAAATLPSLLSIMSSASIPFTALTTLETEPFRQTAGLQQNCQEEGGRTSSSTNRSSLSFPPAPLRTLKRRQHQTPPGGK